MTRQSSQSGSKGAHDTVKEARFQASDRERWARAFFATIDNGDVIQITELFTPNVRLRFANSGVVSGRDAARATFERTGASLLSVHHDVIGVWSGADGTQAVVSFEALVTYELKDARR
jgi:ketosteroid isomerase-like protein